MKYLLGDSREEQEQVLEEFKPILKKIISIFKPGILSYEDLYHEALFGLANAIKAYKRKKGALNFKDPLLKQYVNKYVRAHLTDFSCKFLIQRPRYIIDIRRMFDKLEPITDQRLKTIFKNKGKEYGLLKKIAIRGNIPFTYTNILLLWTRVRNVKMEDLELQSVHKKPTQEKLAIAKECLQIVEELCDKKRISKEAKTIFLRWALFGEPMINLSKEYKITKSAVSQIIRRVRNKVNFTYNCGWRRRCLIQSFAQSSNE